MDKDEMKESVRLRMEEFEDMEDLVNKFRTSIKHLSSLTRGSMISAYRQGLSDMLNYLDHKAIDLKKKRDAINQLTQNTRG